MEKVNEFELENIKGGIGIWGALGIGSLIVLLAGIIDGYTRPMSCND